VGRQVRRQAGRRGAGSGLQQVLPGRRDPDPRNQDRGGSQGHQTSPV